MLGKTHSTAWLSIAAIGLAASLLLASGNVLAKPTLSEIVTNMDALKSLDLCEGLVTDKEPRRVKPVGRPPYGQRYRDPAFGTTVIRISNSSKDEIYG